ncbi:MAG: excinuclease ABC subunit B [Chloroflexi bacterium]|nr:excinuclease ABC subunit B [Chloroflexota bacterium]|tara:strand:+ start:7742 stop:9724 length:1983 start_codon:yes stop_codon:yes gene_type:complete
MEKEVPFKIISPFNHTGDQPNAIKKIVQGIDDGLRFQTLLGVTGSGKTFTMAGIIEETQKPTLVIAHNKTLAAQLASELQEFFPNNSVQYFVSYYDYYQPEAYIPRTDTYIEKESDINDEIDRLRHASTRSILTRNDTIIVASVSCIYGLGSPHEYKAISQEIKIGDSINSSELSRKLISMYFNRDDYENHRGSFSIKGDIIEVIPSYEEFSIKIEFFGDIVDKITEVDILTKNKIRELNEVSIYPSKHFVTPEESLSDALYDIEDELEKRIIYFEKNSKLLEAQRIKERTNYDLEMLRETGSCPGVENYSLHLGRREIGSPPWTLLDYFNEDYLIFIDESHITVPQINGMYKGDQSRKQTLVEHGFRLPSAKDNRPLSFEEFENRIPQTIFVSATPGKYEEQNQQDFVEQIIRPTGLLDPKIILEPTKNQVDNLIKRIQDNVQNGQRTLVTTLTKKMSEELSEYMRELGIKVHYLHSEIDTIERIEILRDLRLGTYDVVVGINLLREGLDLPEVSLVAILDADKEGYLRSSTSLIQTIGRAARHEEGRVVMYADNITKSMHKAIDETNRRRKIQEEHNNKNNIVPTTIIKEVRDITEKLKESNSYEEKEQYKIENISDKNIHKLIKDLEKEMKNSAKVLEFEKAALIRDQISELRKNLK